MVPSKLRRKNRKKQLRINAKLKRRLYDGVVFTFCCYCKQVFLLDVLTIEHVVPRSLGGTNDDNNISLACFPCNQKQGKRTWIFKRRQIRETTMKGNNHDQGNCVSAVCIDCHE